MKVAFLTAGGIAPCLSASIISLIKNYNNINNTYEFIGYLNGYKGLLMGNSVKIPSNISDNQNSINIFGGSFLGNSRVKLSNVRDCIKNKYVKCDESPLEVAANQLMQDQISILHTIGGDDTNTTAAELVDYLDKHNYNLTVVGFPKTIDNDIYPISQTLGAYTAAEQTSLFFKNIVNENTTSSRQLIIHEIMGRNCGWLTAYSGYLYMQDLMNMNFFNEIGLSREKWSIHGLYIPEIKFNLKDESIRLNKIMNKYDCVNIFLSEGAGIENIINEMKNNNDDIPIDAFGHIRLDEINPGQWYAEYFKEKLDCDKILVQKSGYFSRSSSPSSEDMKLIEDHAKNAVKYAISENSGVVGIDDDTGKLNCISFKRIKGGKPFNVNYGWFKILIENIEKC